MRKGLWIVAAVALLGGGVAMAQDQPRSEDHGRPGAGPGQSREEQRPSSGRQEERGNEGAPKRAAPHAQSRRQAGPRPGGGPRPPHRFLSGGGWHRSIHGPKFVYPAGFRYQVWTTGATLPPVFLSGSYFYDDYAALGLAPPPGGYRWVRYGPDLLLVNLRTGRIADVVDGVFY
ncbi:MAG TPA: RcnB family protein [Steroidobacteraceae bacterium]|nr:RcnB family protein [Steroidobacteraceae bacterium]